MKIKIYKQDNTVLTEVTVLEDSVISNEIRGEHTLSLSFSSAEYSEIPEGAYVILDGTTYTLLSQSRVTMNNTRSNEVTAVFEAAQAILSSVRMRNPDDGTLSFPYTATAGDHLALIIANLNRYSNSNEWAVGECVDDGTMKYLQYDYVSCLDALNSIADIFGTEWEISGTTVSLHKVEYNISSPLELEYGKMKGLRPGIVRETAARPLTRIYTQGGSRNIDASQYGSAILLLPKSVTFKYDGSKFEDEAGFDNDKARTYTTDTGGTYISSLKNASRLVNEGVIDCTDIYPSATHSVIGFDYGETVPSWVTLNVPENLDYSQYVILGELPTVTFQSGNLQGKTFEIRRNQDGSLAISKEYTELGAFVGWKFMIASVIENGMRLPDLQSGMVPENGDTCRVFGVQLPAEYICDNENKTGASWDMLRRGITYLYEYEDSIFSLKVEIDPIWAITNWDYAVQKFRIGGYVKYTNSSWAQGGVMLRIQSIRQGVSNPYSIEIELGNGIVGGGILKGLEDKISRQAGSLSEQESSQKTLEYNVSNIGGNFVTLDTEQTITAKKTFAGDVVLGGERQDGSYGRAFVPSHAGPGVYDLYISNAPVAGEAPSGGGGIDETELWSILGTSGTQQIDASHMSNALAGYATQQWVEGRGYLTSSALTPYATKEWVQQQGYLTEDDIGSLDGYVTLDTAQTVTGAKTFAALLTATGGISGSNADLTGYLAAGKLYVPSYNGNNVYDLYISNAPIAGEAPSGSSGIDEAELWSILTDNAGGERIAKAHLPLDTVYDADLTSALGNYLPLAGGTMHNGAGIKWALGTMPTLNLSRDSGLMIGYVATATPDGSTPADIGYLSVLSVMPSYYGFQLASTVTAEDLFYRRNGTHSGSTAWSSWKRLLDTSNIGSYALTQSNYASTLDSRYVNVSGDTMTGPLKYISEGNRYLTLSEGGLHWDFSDAPGGHAESWTRVTEPDGSSYTGMGVYGGPTGLYYIYLGGTYTAPWVTLVPSGNVGIGTTTPAYKLDVAGTLRAPDFSGAYISDGAVNYYVGDAANGAGSGKSGLLLYAYGSRNIYLYTNSEQRMVVNASGNVGIGTASPAYKLDVTGEIRATSGITIGSKDDIGWYYTTGDRICAGQTTARGVNVGSLLVSNIWSDYTKVPTNGIYSKGDIWTGGRLYIPSYNGNNVYDLYISNAPIAGEAPSGSSGIDEAELWSILTDNAGGERIAKAHLPLDTVYDADLTSALGNYLPLAGGTMHNGAGIKWALGTMPTLNLSRDSGLMIGYVATATPDGSTPADIGCLSVLSVMPSYYGFQLASTVTAEDLFYRRNGSYSGSATWSSWKRLLDTSNIGSYALTKSNYSATLDARYLLKSTYTAADVLAKLKTVDGSGSGLDADLLDGLHSASLRYLSIYNPSSNGVLVRTDISSSSDEMFSVHICGNTYMSARPIDSRLEFYSYATDDVMLNCSLQNNGYAISSVKIFCYDGYVYIWLPYINRYHSYSVYVNTTIISKDRNHAVEISSGGVPSGATRVVTVTPKNVALTTDNVASATKLATARTLWGRPFDGTGNVSGNMSGVTHIYNSATRGVCLRHGNSFPTNAGDLLGVVGVGMDINSYGLYMWSRGDGRGHVQVGRADGTNTAYDLILQEFGGNVGIGTTSPAYKLDVAGTLRATGRITAAGLTSSASIVANAGITTTTLEASGAVAADNFILRAYSGNWARGFYVRNKAQDAVLKPIAGVYGQDDTVYYCYYGQGSYSSADGLRIYPSGNVSIGYAGESHRLRVQGTGYFSGAVSMGGTLSVSGLVKASAGVQIGSTDDIGWYYTSGSRICAGQTTARGVNVGSLLVSNIWSDYTKVPTNGIYSKGDIWTGGRLYIPSYSGNQVYDLYISNAPIAGTAPELAAEVETLKILSTASEAHLSFSATSYAYLVSQGDFAFIPDGQSTSASRADLIVSNGYVRPGSTGVTYLGMSTARWATLYCGSANLSATLYVSGNSTMAGDLTVSGEFSNPTSSSREVKDIIAPAATYSQRLAQMGKVIDYRYNGKIRRDGSVHTGLIYEAVRDIMPAMCLMQDGYGALNYLCPDYINTVAGAVQEHTDEIAALRQRIAELENEVKQLKAA